MSRLYHLRRTSLTNARSAHTNWSLHLEERIMDILISKICNGKREDANTAHGSSVLTTVVVEREGGSVPVDNYTAATLPECRN